MMNYSVLLQCITCRSRGWPGGRFRVGNRSRPGVATWRDDQVISRIVAGTMNVQRTCIGVVGVSCGVGAILIRSRCVGSELELLAAAPLIIQLKGLTDQAGVAASRATRGTAGR